MNKQYEKKLNKLVISGEISSGELNYKVKVSTSHISQLVKHEIVAIN